MSHQTGITASQEVKDFFASAKSEGGIRLIKCGISTEPESIVLLDNKPIVGSWDEDYDPAILSVIKEREPCYIFYRLDTQNELGYEWLFLSYSPDASEVRKKMLFSATRATVKMEFGGGAISDEIFGTIVNDVNLDGYRKHVAGKDVAAPLTAAEEELNEVKMQHIEAATGGKSATLPGISFPIDDNAITELIRIAQKEISYVQLSVDVENETINLVKACDLDVGELKDAIPNDSPRYHFFVFKHTHEGDYLESIIFIYSMPGYSCSIKERMLYSSCKAPLLGGMESVLNMEIAKKLEIDADEKLDEAALLDHVHPQKNIVRQKFAKPQGPGGRGPKRLNKKPQDNGQ